MQTPWWRGRKGKEMAQKARKEKERKEREKAEVESTRAESRKERAQERTGAGPLSRGLEEVERRIEGVW